MYSNIWLDQWRIVQSLGFLMCIILRTHIESTTQWVMQLGREEKSWSILENADFALSRILPFFYEIAQGFLATRLSITDLKSGFLSSRWARLWPSSVGIRRSFFFCLSGRNIVKSCFGMLIIKLLLSQTPNSWDTRKHIKYFYHLSLFFSPR